jgi:hypothetical protein
MHVYSYYRSNAFFLDFYLIALVAFSENCYYLNHNSQLTFSIRLNFHYRHYSHSISYSWKGECFCAQTSSKLPKNYQILSVFNCLLQERIIISDTFNSNFYLLMVILYFFLYSIIGDKLFYYIWNRNKDCFLYSGSFYLI